VKIVEGSTQLRRRADDHRLQSVERRTASLHCPRARRAQGPDRLDDAATVLRRDRCRTGEHRPGSGLGVDGVTLATLAPQATVGAIDLDYWHAFSEKMARQPGAVGAGAFDPDLGKLAVTTHPGEQTSIARGVGLELSRTEDPAGAVDHRCVVAATVGIDAADDARPVCCHAGPAFP
jgi:hypothetical protein